MLHRIEPSRPELREVLTALYEASFVADPTQTHYPPDGTSDTGALDLRRGLSQSTLLTPLAQAMGRLIRDARGRRSPAAATADAIPTSA